MTALVRANNLRAGATFSSCRRYRYALWREWDPGKPTVVFCGLNPSTADETADDPTIRRCLRFARDWGFGHLVMLNAYAWRSTDPRALLEVDDPTGPENLAIVLVDVISGGFPCQDISSAGTRAGITGARSGLWIHFARIIREVRPGFVLVENSPDLTSRGLDVVLGNLAALGYDADWDVLGARHVGAPHWRDRIWIVASDAAHPAGIGPQGPVVFGAQAEGPRRSAADGEARGGARLPPNADHEGVQLQPGWCCGSRGAEAPERGHAREERGPWRLRPDFEGVADGVAHRVDRTRATGNGQVPAVVRLAWEALMPEAHV